MQLRRLILAFLLFAAGVTLTRALITHNGVGVIDAGQVDSLALADARDRVADDRELGAGGVDEAEAEAGHCSTLAET